MEDTRNRQTERCQPHRTLIGRPQAVSQIAARTDQPIEAQTAAQIALRTGMSKRTDHVMGIETSLATGTVGQVTGVPATG